MAVEIYFPVLCDMCGEYIENQTYFATDIGLAITQAIGFCSAQCWRDKIDEYRVQFSKESF